MYSNTAKQPQPAIDLLDGFEFWGRADLCSLVKQGGVELIPTLVFDLEQKAISWACFAEDSGRFATVKDMAKAYGKIVQSL